jgi:hypothetical protein
MNDTIATGAAEASVIQTVSPALAEKIAKETCILEIHRHEPGFEKKIDSGVILNSAEDPGISSIDPKRLSVYKFLITRKEIRDLQRHRTKFFDRLKEMSLPGGMLTLGNGQYLIPVSRIGEVRAEIDTYLSERSALLDEFELRYPDVIAAAKERLGSLFNPDDYPAFPAIRAQYSTTYKFVSNTVPEEIQRISQQIYDQEQARILAECAAVTGLIQNTLRDRFVDLVNHFSERLGMDEKTGKPRRFHGSNVEHFESFIKAFSDMNLTGDTDLAELVKKADVLIKGADPGKIRTDAEFRLALETGFNEIKAAADKLVVDRKRKVILED